MRPTLQYMPYVVNRLLGPVGLKLTRSGAPRTDLFWRSSVSPELKYSQIVPAASYAPWLSDDLFIKLFNQVRSHTLVDIYRCFELWELARQATAVPGHFLEVGVWKGGTACLMAKVAGGSGKTIYLADTFKGVVKAGAEDGWYQGGEHADTSRQVVEEVLRSTGADNFKILTGTFPDETARFLQGNIAFLHIDVDVYQSAKDIFDWAVPRMSRGAIVVFDDYGFDRCSGITTFCNEVKAMPDFLFFHNLNGHAVVVRR